MAGKDAAKGAVARVITEQVAKAPELLAPLADCAVLERHEDLVDLLMAAAFPPATRDNYFGAAMVPFQLHGFYATPPMERLLMTADWRLKGRVNLDASLVAAMRRAYAYALVLHRMYGIDVELDNPLILTVPDPDTGLDRHFRLIFDWTFVEVEAKGPLPELPADMRERIQANLLDALVREQLLTPTQAQELRLSLAATHVDLNKHSPKAEKGRGGDSRSNGDWPNQRRYHGRFERPTKTCVMPYSRTNSATAA